MHARPAVLFGLALVFFAGFLAPVASNLESPREARDACRCLVKMDCCLSGLCHMDDPPRDGSFRWASCSGAPGSEAAPVLTLPPAVGAPRFEVAAASDSRRVLLEDVLGPALRPSEAPDHVPIL